MSKGGKILARIKEAMPALALPGQWWGCDAGTRRDIKGRIIRLDSVCAGSFWSRAMQLPLLPQIYFTRPVEITSETFGIRRVGLVGRVNFEWAKNYVEELTACCYVT